jgi:H+-transporting ATPase
LQTLVFLMLVFTGQGNVYLVREREHERLWHSRPSRCLVLSTVADVVVVSLMATSGILMASISWSLVASLLNILMIFLFVIDGVKVHILRRFGVR